MGKPVEAADYHDLVRATAARASPDGETVAVLRETPDTDEEYEATVYTVPADGGKEPRRFTAEEGVDAEPRWSPSGDRLAFVSDRGTEGTPQLRVVPATGGESRRVTDVVGGVSDIAWSPDGTRIAFTQTTRPEEREADHDLSVDDDYEREEPDPRVHDRTVYRAFESYFDGGRSHVYVVDLTTETVTRLTDGDRDYQFPAWADDDHLFYAVKADVPDPDDTIEFDIKRVVATGEGGDPEHVATTTDYAPRLAVAEDGRLAYPRTPPRRAAMRQTDLCVFDPTDGSETVVTADLDRSVGRSRSMAWDDGDLYFLTPDSGHVTVRRARVDDGAIDTVVGDGHATAVHAAGGIVAVARSTASHPDDAFAHAGELTRLTAFNADYLAEHDIGVPERISFESDGYDLDGWVLTPPDANPDEEYPLVVEVHGGPHASWTAAGSTWHEFQTLAARGYVVFWSNPRGSLGYGDEFTQAIAENWGEVTMRDVLAGANVVSDRPEVDEGQQFLTGGSFGGYMTAWMVGHTNRFAGAVAQRGVYDLASFYGSTDGAYRLVEDDFDALPWEEPGYLAAHSPATYADDVETPTLVVHAENDYRVPVCNGELFYRYLRKQGVDTRMVRYPREGHELSRSGEPAHVVDRIERIVRWFDGYSEHHDANPALDRGRTDGLSAEE
ncbi:S9 family peptidase [Halosegnis sp.]|uniref:S9 family peptidase n=1 Tax=Halosegnis sp. TaxID=2864959 RepID=UPI0035D514FB